MNRVGWSIRENKQLARTNVKRNYVKSFSVCLILGFLVGGLMQATSNPSVPTSNFQIRSNTQVVNDILQSVFSNRWSNIPQIPTGQIGVIASLFNNATQSGSLVFGILNAINKEILNEQILAPIILFLGFAILCILRVFVGNILLVGKCRFFMESRRYPQTEINRILYIYNIRKALNTAKIMFILTMRLILWGLTVVGIFIKAYSYQMVPYLLAENADITVSEAFNLSHEMMRGHKWRSFLLDCSFIGWWLISFLTFGIIGKLYVEPYIEASHTELYFNLKTGVVPQKFQDSLLENRPCHDCGHYPVHKGHYAESRIICPNVPFKRYYSLFNSILLFFCIATLGWLWEAFIFAISTGTFYNRGVLHGPWLPIYGFGGLCITFVLKPFMKKPIVVFSLSFVICGIIEYLTGMYLELVKGFRWWDYSDILFNIQGYICLEGLMFFGMGGCLISYFLAPALDALFDKISPKFRYAVCAILLIVFIIDTVYSIWNPNMNIGPT